MGVVEVFWTVPQRKTGAAPRRLFNGNRTPAIYFTGFIGICYAAHRKKMTHRNTHGCNSGHFRSQPGFSGGERSLLDRVKADQLTGPATLLEQ